MFHRFHQDIEGIEPPKQFTFPFCYSPHRLTVLASEEVKNYLNAKTEWKDEIGAGKMFGVLVVENQANEIGFLAAYSGNIAGRNDHEYFVPAVYDLLNPKEYFKHEEANISSINRSITEMEQSVDYAQLKRAWAEKETEGQKEIAEFNQHLKAEKKKRNELRKGEISEEQQQALIKQSQFEKAELHRLKLRYASEIAELKGKVETYEQHIEQLKQERRQRSAALQEWLFHQFVLLNGNGEKEDLIDIFKDYRNELPPAGTGECAAPKLLQYAFLHHMKPLAMGEFWWGASPKGEIREHLHFYPSCISKCEPILHFMLQGIDVEPNPLDKAPSQPTLKMIYEDDAIMVVSKPEGMLSAPGKNEKESVYDFAKAHIKGYDGPMIVHRLDMHTSGILVVAKNKDAYLNLQKQFTDRTVKKRYIALLEGNIEQDKGIVNLPLCLDHENRPQQMVDFERGKEAVTEFEVIERKNGKTKIAFYPITGRTHQLRVHAAHQLGLKAPIKGDMLYGTHAERLYLHAEYLEFEHPESGERVKFTDKAPF